MNDLWFKEGVEGIIRERLENISDSLQAWVLDKSGLSRLPSPYEKYFSRMLLDHAVNTLKLDDFVKIEHQPKFRKLRFFKRSI